MRRKAGVYLAGPIHQCNDRQVKTWRKTATTKLGKYYTILDPVERDYRDNKDGKLDSIIVEGDKKDIDRCDVILVNWWKPSCGTPMEILYAWERKKLIITVTGGDVSPWLRYHSTKIFETLEQAISRLVEIHDKISIVSR